MSGPRDVADTYFESSFLTGSVTASVGSQQLVPFSSYRKNFFIMNDTPDLVFVRFQDGAASSQAFTIRIPSYVLYELPKPPLRESIHVACGGSSGSVRWLEIS